MIKKSNNKCHAKDIPTVRDEFKTWTHPRCLMGWQKKSIPWQSPFIYRVNSFLYQLPPISTLNLEKRDPSLTSSRSNFQEWAKLEKYDPFLISSLSNFQEWAKLGYDLFRLSSMRNLQEWAIWCSTKFRWSPSNIFTAAFDNNYHQLIWSSFCSTSKEDKFSPPEIWWRKI